MMRTALVLAALALPGAMPAEAKDDSRSALIAALDKAADARLDARAAAVARIATPAAADARKAWVRAEILKRIGGLPPRTGPLAAKVTGSFAGKGFRVEKVMFDAMPGQHITANLFVPTGRTGPYPAVIVAPGHGPNGKAGNYAFAASFARNGIVALAYDIVGEGERMEYWDAMTGRSRGERPTGDHSIAGFQTMLTGDHLARYFINEEMRGIDYLISRREVDANRIGAFGCSGGGTATAYVAAMDDRVRAAGVACYVNDFKHLLAGPGPQDGEQSIPGFISSGLDVPDWVELAAPKPYAVISTTEDMFPFEGAKAAVAEARRFWGAYGKADRLEWYTGPGPHGAIAPMANRIIDFFRRNLRATGPVVPFERLQPPRPEDVLVTPTGQIATSGGGTTIADINRARARAIVTPDSPPARVREAIRALTGAKGLSGAAPDADIGEAGRMTLALANGPLQARIKRAAEPSGRILLLLDPGTPLDALAASNGRMAKLAAAGWTVVALQPRGADGSEEIKSSLVGDQNLLALRALLVGRTLTGIRIDDVIATIDWLARLEPGARITVAASGTMGPIALQAAALDPRIAAVRLTGSQVSFRDAVSRPIAPDLPAIAVPGVLKAYDLRDVIRALDGRPVELVAPVDPVGVPLRETEVTRLMPKGATWSWSATEMQP
ncbi:alpha/beta hydrolase family protein [Sphingomonas mali]|uniref:alpha/beta hydrolase family protein n=1 Tax=Sphingomonas mali TaxID=40682 RepID=UPI000836E814|nr:acetylxylan esterase [Sphingomonas mali]